MPVTFQNRSALFLWGCAAFWLLSTLHMTYGVLSGNVQGNHNAWTLTAFTIALWACAVLLIASALAKPFFLIHVHAGSKISLALRYPHKVVLKEIPISQLAPALVIDGEYSKHDYYFVRVKIPDEQDIDIFEGKSKNACEQECTRFNQALFGDTMTNNLLASEVVPGVEPRAKSSSRFGSVKK